MKRMEQLQLIMNDIQILREREQRSDEYDVIQLHALTSGPVVAVTVVCCCCDVSVLNRCLFVVVVSF